MLDKRRWWFLAWHAGGGIVCGMVAVIAGDNHWQLWFAGSLALFSVVPWWIPEETRFGRFWKWINK